MKEFLRVALFIILAPLFLGIALFMHMFYQKWLDLGNFS
jgi:hypothetical protein